MANTALMREVADHIEQHPRSYSSGWRHCVAGTAVRLAGGKFIGKETDLELWAHDMLRPTRDDPANDVRTVPDYANWASSPAGTRYVTVEARAKRLFDISDTYQLFIGMFGVDNREDTQEVADFLRRKADEYDSGEIS